MTDEHHRDDLHDTAIAEQLGINRRTLSRWRRFDEYGHFIRALSAYTHRRWSTGRYATTRAGLDADWAQLDQLFAGMEVRA